MSKSKFTEIHHIDYQAVVYSMIPEMGPVPGCNIGDVTHITKGLGFIELPDGRVAEIQISLQTDEDEFIAEFDQ